MSFRNVELPLHTARRETEATVGISGRVGLTIGFGRTLAAELKLPAGSRFGLQVGEGENAGLIRLVPSQAGRVLRQSKKGGATISCGSVDAFAHYGEQKKQYCRVEALEGGGIQIRLPKWKPGGSTDADAGDRHSFTFSLDPDQAEHLRDMADDEGEEVPDYVANVIGTYIEEYQKEKAED